MQQRAAWPYVGHVARFLGTLRDHSTAREWKLRQDCLGRGEDERILSDPSRSDVSHHRHQVPDLDLVVDPPAAEVGSAIHDGLRAFNRQFAGPGSITRFAILVRDAEGTAIGGLDAHLRWDWLCVDNLWLPAVLRGQGVGSALLRKAEAFARSEGCVASCLDTFEFQALPFYQRHAYEVFGIQNDYPPGFRRYFLQKRFEPAT